MEADTMQLLVEHCFRHQCTGAQLWTLQDNFLQPCCRLPHEARGLEMD